jgi:hypothetical protein
MTGVATAGFGLYNALDNVQDMQISVDSANLKVKSSANSLEDAKRRLTDASVALEKAERDVEQATEKYGEGSKETTKAVEKAEEAREKYEGAVDDVKLAEERNTVAVERADMVQGNYNETIARSAMTIIPSAITMVDSFSRAWKNFPDVSGIISNIGTKVADVGISAKTAAIGVAAFIGSFLIADAFLKGLPDNLRQIASALMLGIAAIVAATIAWLAFHGTVTVGIAVPIILAAVGAGIAGIKGLIGFAEGGIVTRPTAALIGEAGPEAVIPLNRLGQGNNIEININIEGSADEATAKRAAELVGRELWRRTG